MHRRQVLSATFSLAASAVALPSAIRAQSLTTLRMAGPPTEDLTPFYYAVENKLFERVGLDVQLVPTSSGSAAAAAVIAGTYELCKTSLNAVFVAHLRDIPLQIVAPEVTYTKRYPFALLQLPMDSTVKTGSDLNGKTIGVPALGDLNVLATRAWSDKNGGDWKSLKFVEIPNAVSEAALQQHRVDAAVMQSPQLDASLEAGTSKTLGDAYGAIAPDFMFAAFVARADWAAKNADVLRRYNRALGQAIAYVNGHFAETTGVVADLTKIPAEKLVKMHRSISASSLDVALIQPYLDASAKYDIIPHGFPAREILWAG